MSGKSSGSRIVAIRTEAILVKCVKPLPKKQAEVLCQCPQKCDKRVPKEVRDWFFKQFQSVDDRTRQNAWLQSQIEMRSVYKRLWSAEDNGGGKLQRRVSCKYRVPTNIPQRLFPTMCGKVNTVEVCMKAFMNVYGVTEKRIRLQRERMISELRKDTTDDVALELASLESLPPAIIDAVDMFFINQLWKPEYIAVKETKEAATKTADIGDDKALPIESEHSGKTDGKPEDKDNDEYETVNNPNEDTSDSDQD